MAPTSQEHVVGPDGQPGSAQHLVPGNAVGSHALGAAVEPEGNWVTQEHPSPPALHEMTMCVEAELQAMAQRAAAVNSTPTTLAPVMTRTRSS
jgi:hypothetical protein